MSGLVAEAVSLTLGGTRVLDRVSAAFAPGQVTAVLGPNGAGKSSLLALLAGLRLPDAGRILVDGVARETLGRRELARRIGFLPQTAEVHWSIDVRTLVELGRFPHRGRWGWRDADHAAVALALAATDTARFADRPVDTLSGGERGRVLLARVLAGEPRWLLADEPLANLDPAHQLDALDTLREVAAGGTGVIVVLHDLNHAARVADHILLLREGAVVAEGAPDAILDPATIARAFDIAVEIGTSGDGCPFVVPLARRLALSPTRP